MHRTGVEPVSTAIRTYSLVKEHDRIATGRTRTDFGTDGLFRLPPPHPLMHRQDTERRY